MAALCIGCEELSIAFLKSVQDLIEFKNSTHSTRRVFNLLCLSDSDKSFVKSNDNINSRF